MSNSSERLKKIIEDLTGQVAVRDTEILIKATESLEKKQGIGGSQLNEILLLMGLDRTKPEFFQYLVDGTTKIKSKATINSFEDFERGVSRFRKLSLLNFGNVKFSFKLLSDDVDLLNEYVNDGQPVHQDSYRNRHEPIFEIDEIPVKDTYYLGYLIEDELKKRLEKNPDDKTALEEEKKRKDIVKKGEKNQEAYLAFDHMDVYVATSMRKKHEYIMVNKLVKDIFNHDDLSDLNLRWFDPTQAYCKDRIDKGLSEGLMLKRARCTIYSVQESDTLGKDSELAATLAQGKPVIAYVPEADTNFIDDYLEQLRELYPDQEEIELLLEQLQIFNPESAWCNEIVQNWLKNKAQAKIEDVKDYLKKSIKEHYDKRAKTFKEIHPLGIQVCLNNGVANGVLVVRSICDCVKVLKSILLNEIEFNIEVDIKDGKEYLYLTEMISGSIFRVVSGDIMLSNAFWNFYLNE